MKTIVVLLCLALCGCPTIIREPTVEPPPAPAAEGTTVCHNGAPWRFTASVWSQADRQCNRLADAGSVVCCLTASPFAGRPAVHACVTPSTCMESP